MFRNNPAGKNVSDLKYHTHSFRKADASFLCQRLAGDAHFRFINHFPGSSTKNDDADFSDLAPWMNLPLLRSCKPGFAEGCFLGCLEKAVFAKQESPTGTKQRCNCGHNLENDGASGPLNASLYHY